MVIKLKKIVAVIFPLYLAVLFYLALISPYYYRDISHSNLNLIPFKTIFEYLQFKHGFNSTITNLLGNIAVFIPMGFLLPLIHKKFTKLKSIVLISAITTFFIEAMQYIMRVGVSDIDDISLNIFGGVVGFFMYKTLLSAKTSMS